jgi:hypothetical protein
MASPHVYSFSIHPDVLHERDTLFEEFNPYQMDCFCVPRPFWGTEYSFKDMPPLLSKLADYVYNELALSGFQVKRSGRLTLVEYRDSGNHVSPPRFMFNTQASRQVGVVLVFQKDSCMYDSALSRTEKVPLKNPMLRHLSYDSTFRSDLAEGVGVMYHQPHYIDYIGGTGCYRIAILLFDQK